MSDTNFSIEEELPIILLKKLPCLYDEMESNTRRISTFCIFIDSKKLVQSFFVEAIKTLASLQVTRKKVNLGEGFQIPFKLHFTRDAKCIDKIYLFFIFSHFCIINGQKIKLRGIFFALATKEIVQIRKCVLYLYKISNSYVSVSGCKRC